MLSLGWFFGYDVFISYARRDGKGYAVLLQQALQKRKYRCFLDNREMGAGETLEHSIRQALQRSSSLVVLGTQASLTSPFVRGEIELFRNYRKRKIVPVDFGGVLEGEGGKAEPGIWLRNLIWIDEAPERLMQGPSPEAIDALIQSFRFTKRNTMRGIGVTLLSTVVAILLAFAAYFGWRSIQEKARAEQEKAHAEVVRKQREIDRLTTDAGQFLEFDPYRSALTMLTTMELADRASEVLPSAAENIARQWSERRLKFVLEGHQNNLLSTDWSSDGRWLVTGGYDDVLRFWDAKKDWIPSGAVDFGKTIGRVRISPSDDKVAMGDEDGTTVGVWSMPEKRFLWTQAVKLDSKLMELAWSPDETSIYVVGRKIVRLSVEDGTQSDWWQSEDKRQLRAFSIAGRCSNCGFGDGRTFRILHLGPEAAVATSLEERTVELPHRPNVSGWVTLKPKYEKIDGEKRQTDPGGLALLLGYDNDQIQLWRPKRGLALLQRISGAPETIRIEEGKVFVGTEVGTIDGFDAVEDGVILFPAIRTGHRVTDLAYSPDHKWIAAVSGSERLARIYEPEQVAARRVYDDIEVAPNQECWIAFSHDGSRFAAGERTLGTIYIGSPKKDKPEELEATFEHKMPKDDALSGKLQWSQKWLAAGYGSGVIRLFQGTDKDEAPLEVPVAKEPVYSISWRPGTEELVTSIQDGRVFMVDAAKSPATVQEIPVLAKASWPTWSADGQEIVGFDGEHHQVVTWTSAGGRKAVPKAAGSGLSVVADMRVVAIVSRPKRDQVALAGFSGELAVVDYQSGKILATRAGNGTPIFDVDWSPDGAVLAAARYDGTIQCFRGDDLGLVEEAPTGIPALSAIKWHPDGSRVFAGGRSNDSSLVCMHFPPLAEIRAEMQAYVRLCERRSLSITTRIAPPE